jgi:hypothetical protein
VLRPFQENKPPKYKLSSEEKASGLEGFKFWNYLSEVGYINCLFRQAFGVKVVTRGHTADRRCDAQQRMGEGANAKKK